MSVISDSHPAALHLHSSYTNMLESSKPAAPPSIPPQFSLSDMQSVASPNSASPPIPGLEQKSYPASSSSSLSSTSQLTTNQLDFETAQPTFPQYVPAGTPHSSNSEKDSWSSRTDIPLLTTFPTEVPLSSLPGLASSAGDCTGEDGRSLSLDVVSVLLSEGSRNESQSFEAEETLATDSTRALSDRHGEAGFEAGSRGEACANGLVFGLNEHENTSLSGSNPNLKEEHGLNQGESTIKDRPVHASLSMPVSMPSAFSTILGDDADQSSVSRDVKTSQHKPKVIVDESVHLVQDTYANSEDLVPDEAVARTKSMPVTNSGNSAPKFLRRSSTEKRIKAKNINDARIRVPPEVNRLSDRRKKKLLRKLATIKKDGAVEFDMGESSQAAKDLFGYGFTPREEVKRVEDEDERVRKKAEDDVLDDLKSIPPLQIVMLIVGTRGDVQPFIAIGKRLQGYGHRVRLASHKNFENFVKREGLEFYPLGGDPVVLAGYMVKNKGFLPSTPSEIPVQRRQIKSIVYSLLAACTLPDLGSGIPFQAQAIIANPPAYGHVHVAEYLKIPLHIFFTMPWTPTSAFPHPLSRVKQSAGYRMSYQVVDTLIWLGIRGIINSFRKNKLNLRPITYLSGSQGSIAEMPTGYIWSPHLVPKPRDWGPLVDVVGFCFLNLATDYKPPEDLVNWLQAGPPPIYIGFGSLPVEDPEGMTKTIVEALNKTGQRGIIGKGWGGIGNLPEIPENIFLVSDCPHDWLFPQCAAVVHHGGAGTTSAGLKAACPTTIIPFFGDQPFWGDRVHEKGVGPVPIPVNHFNLEKLVHAIEFMLDPAVKRAALELSKAMESEDGIEGAVNAFHKHIHKHVPHIVCKLEPLRTRRRSIFSKFRTCFSFI